MSAPERRGGATPAAATIPEQSRELKRGERASRQRKPASSKSSTAPSGCSPSYLGTDPRRAEVELAHAAETAVEWAAGAPLILGGDVNLRPQSTSAFGKLESAHGLTGTTAPDAIDHLLSCGLETVESPRAVVTVSAKKTSERYPYAL